MDKSHMFIKKKKIVSFIVLSLFVKQIKSFIVATLKRYADNLVFQNPRLFVS